MDVAVRQLMRELLRRKAPKVTASAQADARLHDYYATLFDKQLEFINCWAPFLAVFCTRRAGKSKAIPGKVFKAAARWPGTVIYYIHPDGSTRAEETIRGPDINIERVVDEYGLPWKYNANLKKLINTEDGTELRIRGADDAREAKKYRGDKVSLVITEETQNFPSVILRALAEDILGPATADVDGQWCSIGTAGEVCSGEWFDWTRNEDDASRAKRKPGWQVLEWSALDNPHMIRQAAGVIARKLLPYSDRTLEQLAALLLSPEGRLFCEALAAADPSLMREWFGRWVNDSSALFYAYAGTRNDYDGTLPPGHTWMHSIGVDLGHDDSFAIQVLAFSATHTDAFEVAHFKRGGMTPAEWVSKLWEFIRRFNPVATVVDTGGLGKAIVEEWKTRDGLPVESAEKSSKSAFVSLLNSDLRAGRLHVLAGGPWASEMAALPKDPNSPSHKPPQEHPGHPNHSCDAGLYGWREALHWLGRDVEDGPKPGSPEWLHAQEAAREQRLSEEVRRALQQDDEW